MLRRHRSSCLISLPYACSSTEPRTHSMGQHDPAGPYPVLTEPHTATSVPPRWLSLEHFRASHKGGSARPRTAGGCDEKGRFISGGRDCIKPCIPSVTQSGHPTGASQPPLLQHPLNSPALGLLPACHQDSGPAGSMCGANPAPAAVPGPHGTDGQEGGCTGADGVGSEQRKASKWFCPSPYIPGQPESISSSAGFPQQP